MTGKLCIFALVVCLASSLAPIAEGETFPIRRSTPYERGDRWRADITSVKVSKGTVSVAGAEQRVDEKETTRLSAVVTVETVDTEGYAQVWLAKIVRFVGPSEGGSSKPLLRPGDVVMFDRIGEELSVTFENGAPLDEAGSRIAEYLMLADRTDDGPFEPEKEVEIGDNWNADIESMRAAVIAKGPPQLRLYPEVLSIKASGKLLAAKEHRGAQCLDVRLETTTRITEELEDENQYIKKADQLVEERFLIPADYSKDFLDKQTVSTEGLLTESKGAGPSLDITQVTTTTEKRTYLAFAGGGVRPWKVAPSGGALLEDLLVGFDFDEWPGSLSAETARLETRGKITAPLPAKTSGHAAGQIGDALVFDGKDDHINVVGAAEVLRSGIEEVTVACWVKSPPKKVQFIFDIGFYGDTSMSLNVADKTAKFHLAAKTGGVSLDFPLEASEWTHVAVTWDGVVQRAYVNGKLRAESQTKKNGRLDTDSVGDGPFLIGSQSKSASRDQRFFRGQMDEFALWTRALDATEVATVFEKGDQRQSLFDE